MSNKIQDLKDGKYTQKWAAGLLYPELPIKSAQAKLNSKLHSKHGRRLSDSEIKKLENILQ